MPKLDPRPVDDLLVVHSPSAWIDPVRIGAVAIRLPSDLWSTPYGGEFLTMADAIRHARDEAGQRGRAAGIIDQQSACIRDLKAERDLLSLRYQGAERDVDIRRAEAADLRRQIDSARRMVLALQWISVAAVAVAVVAGYALASVGGAP
jgi:hypothetical protein